MTMTYSPVFYDPCEEAHTVVTTALEIVGVGLLCAAAVVLLGVAGALASAGAVALLAAYVLERRA